MKKKTSSSFVWLLYDASDKILGRFSSDIASVLMGKKSVDYRDNIPVQIGVIIINSKKIKVTGSKVYNKKYYRHSGYPGGLKVSLLGDLLYKNPNFVIRHAIKGMLPKNKLQKIFLRHLKIYEGPTHPHIAQSPITGD